VAAEAVSLGSAPSCDPGFLARPSPAGGILRSAAVRVSAPSPLGGAARVACGVTRSALPGVPRGGMTVYKGEGVEQPVRGTCRACVPGDGEVGID
jgi:hypothetical protein